MNYDNGDVDSRLVHSDESEHFIENYENEHSPPKTKTFTFRFHKNELKQNHYSCCKFDKVSNRFKQEYSMQVRKGNLLLLIDGTGFTPKGSLEKSGGTLQKEEYLLLKVDGRITFDTIIFAKTHIVSAGSRGISATGNYRNDLDRSKLTVKKDGTRILEIQIKSDANI